ncbi:hypothetical protein A3J91_00015 [Candidatus Peribacteria bacterium RIFOXYC2_FULL_58_10]|nr:MAG: hypothetical protein A3J91_00015 [Candidatus Peribacteria bacterium RIFOXYC2_FULL_58_10]OGJ84145.1 MAG: hypothetical protein A2529_05165 [Candidatus Peribacteria bacterium RIFOXYD2_FULL_58_15]HAS33979.1 hypothetical protein [Candidatus Peribacteria bacterium]
MMPYDYPTDTPVCLAIEKPEIDRSLPQDPDSIAYYTRELIRAILYGNELMDREDVTINVLRTEYGDEEWYIEAHGLQFDEVATFRALMADSFTVYDDDFEPPGRVNEHNDRWWMGEDAGEEQEEDF